MVDSRFAFHSSTLNVLARRPVLHAFVLPFIGPVSQIRQRYRIVVATSDTSAVLYAGCPFPAWVELQFWDAMHLYHSQAELGNRW